MAYARLREVSPISKNWCIRARVARMWEHCGGRDGLPPLHVDLVLVDDEVRLLRVFMQRSFLNVIYVLLVAG
jgi:hypothetical protein